MKKDYKILRNVKNSDDFTKDGFWEEISCIAIKDYLWMKNSYRPEVYIKVCYNNDYIFVKFDVFEEEITARFNSVNDPVYKDSCVEFFINLFPSESNKYFNFEINAIGTIYVGFGAKESRTKILTEDIKDISIHSILNTPYVGKLKDKKWKIILKIPLKLFEKHYNTKFNYKNAKGNFYKCGDETKYEHYGAWNKIHSELPNFHLPDFFGDLSFSI